MEILWVILIIVFLVCLSAVCSGLNVALLSLDIGDLRRKAKLGNIYAKRVLPFRRNLHLTLASILLLNVAVVSATSLVLENQMSGLLAGLIGTLLIVIFGEIIPQAFFSRSALKFCGRLAPVMRFMIIVTYIVSKPLQLLLDRMLGESESTLQTRHELGLLMTEHLSDDTSELDDDEIEIVRGAITLSEKRVREIMKPIQDVYWLTLEDTIDAAQLDIVKHNGWSRIPVFDPALTQSFGVLLMKDMVDVDFDEHPQLVKDLPLYPSHPVGSMTALDTMFRKFIAAHTHLLPVEKDDVIIGIVTIEDLLEEIVGHEIHDESDQARAKQRSSSSKP